MPKTRSEEFPTACRPQPARWTIPPAWHSSSFHRCRSREPRGSCRQSVPAKAGPPSEREAKSATKGRQHRTDRRPPQPQAATRPPEAAGRACRKVAGWEIWSPWNRDQGRWWLWWHRDPIPETSPAPQLCLTTLRASNARGSILWVEHQSDRAA